MTYMEKKASKRQMAVVSLSDYNQKQMDDLQQEQKDMMAQFDKNKEGPLHGVSINKIVLYYWKLIIFRRKGFQSLDIGRSSGDAVGGLRH